MTYEQMKKNFEESGYTYEQIALLAGLSSQTVQGILDGTCQSEDTSIHRALEAVLSPAYIDRVKEAAPIYRAEKRQGEYTLEDYLALPDERRVELIDGVIYDMAGPSIPHQLIGAQIYPVFSNYIRSNHGDCIPMFAPVDVQLDRDDKTIVQPDLLILCDREKFKYERIYGAPDLVVEILSPSSERKDCMLKMYKYMTAGVREYWIVDPKRKRVIVYLQEDLMVPTIYTFEDQVPVHIFDGKCLVDFREISEYISFLM